VSDEFEAAETYREAIDELSAERDRLLRKFAWLRRAYRALQKSRNWTRLNLSIADDGLVRLHPLTVENDRLRAVVDAAHRAVRDLAQARMLGDEGRETNAYSSLLHLFEALDAGDDIEHAEVHGEPIVRMKRSFWEATVAARDRLRAVIETLGASMRGCPNCHDDWLRAKDRLDAEEVDVIDDALRKALDRNVDLRAECNSLRTVIRQTIGPDPDGDGFTFLWPEYDDETEAFVRSVIDAEEGT
jgi:hypothetical protein